MGSLQSKTKCFILDEYNKKYYLFLSDFKIYHKEVFMFYSIKKSIYLNEVQLFIYKEPKKKNEIRKYIVNLDLKIDKKNLKFIKTGNTGYFEYSITLPENRRITFRFNKEHKFTCLVFKFDANDLHKVN